MFGFDFVYIRNSMSHVTWMIWDWIQHDVRKKWLELAKVRLGLFENSNKISYLISETDVMIWKKICFFSSHHHSFLILFEAFYFPLQRPTMMALPITPCCYVIVNITILTSLAAACLFFSIYDITVEGIFWSLGICIPSFALFLYGLFAWYPYRNSKHEGLTNIRVLSGDEILEASSTDDHDSPDKVSRTLHLNGSSWEFFRQDWLDMESSFLPSSLVTARTYHGDQSH